MDHAALAQRTRELKERKYGVKHSGAALVLGRAACLMEDVAAARALYPDAAVIGCNAAGRYMKCDHIVAVDAEGRVGEVAQERRDGRALLVSRKGGKFSSAVVAWSDATGTSLESGTAAAAAGVALRGARGISPRRIRAGSGPARRKTDFAAHAFG